MQKLLAGIHQFQSEVFATKRKLFQTLEAGQRPLALFITCCDSRVDPNLITQTEPGELFIVRNVGNIVPPYESELGGEAAAIEYAIRVLQVSDVIVCGHSQCGAMGGLLRPEGLEGLPRVSEWLQFAGATKQIIDENYGHLTDPNHRLTVTVEENVLVQLEHLHTHPAIEEALTEWGLGVHGWVYKFESGQVFVYDVETQQFSLPAGTGES